jgi:hypothetical protein
VLRLIDALEEHDDVEAVYANFDIPDSVLEAGERLSGKCPSHDRSWTSGAGLHLARRLRR